MRSILISKLHDKALTVYPENIINNLKSIAALDDGVYNKEEILKNSTNFQDVEYIFSTWGMEQFTEDEIKSIFPSLKAVFYSAGTVQYFARPFLNCGVKVFSAWAANAVPVAEYTIAQILLANKGFFACSELKSHGQEKESYRLSMNYCGNYNANIGLIGVGMIGKLVAKMLKDYKLNVFAYDPFLPANVADELGITMCSLEEIFAKCQVVSNHLANKEQTKNILNYNLFSKMLPYSTFINTGRGAQVREDDLARILKERPDITAILDVTDPEPPVDGHDFYILPNCFMTPHIAGSNGREVERMSEYMVEEFKKFTNNEPTNYEVTLKMLETMA